MTRPFPIDPLTHPDIVCYIIPYLRACPKDTETLARAALVNKAWNAVYTPVLWNEVYIDLLDHDDNIRTAPSLDLQRYGTHIRRLEFKYLDPRRFVVAPQQPQDQQEQHQSWVSRCPNLESLCLLEYNAPLEELYRFLKSVKQPLRQFSLETDTMSPEDVIAALVAMTNSITGGNHIGFEALTKLELGFDIFGDNTDLCWTSLVRLLEAFPRLQMLDLATVDLGASATTTNNDEQEEEEGKEGEEGLGQKLLGIRSLQGQQTNITHLTLRHVRIDDKALLRLLGKTPLLYYVYFNSDWTLGVDIMDALPRLCPKLKHLTLISYGSVSSSVTAKLFQPAFTTATTKGGSRLRLEALHLSNCELDDSSLHQLISTQGESLLSLTLHRTFELTDLRVMTILSGCHRLNSLKLSGSSKVTLRNQDGDGARNFLADVKRKGWPCPVSLKRLIVQ